MPAANSEGMKLPGGDLPFSPHVPCCIYRPAPAVCEPGARQTSTKPVHKMSWGSYRDMAHDHGVKDTIMHKGAEMGLPAQAEAAFLKRCVPHCSLNQVLSFWHATIF